MSLSAGSRLGPYEIVASLGAGGMGEVYRAKDTRLGREVAVKVLPQHLTSNPEIRARFDREAKTVSSLNHPHICTLHDVGREGDIDYLVMELVEGETLAQRLTKGALPLHDVLRYGEQIADALDRAHRAGVMHRDLKPGNVMLTKSGAKLMDFGLARATGLAGPAGVDGLATGMTQSPTMAAPLTAEGTIIGTFQYMAPEQLEGKEADSRADLWALGCVLYESATGRKAFEAKSQASMIGSIMNAEPASISALSPMAPLALDRLVHACLAKDPDDRVQTAHDVRLQLEWIRDAGSQAGLPAPVVARRRSRERLAWILALGMTLVLAAAAGALLTKNAGTPRSDNAVTRFTLSFPTNLEVSDWQLAPDGSALVLRSSEKGADGPAENRSSRLYVRAFDSFGVRPLPGTENAAGYLLAQDSRQVFFVTATSYASVNVTLARVALDGGSPAVTLAPWDPDWDSAAALPGGDILAIRSGNELIRIPAAGGAPVPLGRILCDDPGARFGLLGARSLIDDHTLLLGCSPSDAPGSRGGAAVLDLPTRRARIVLRDGSNPVISPTGHLLFTRGDALLGQRLDSHGVPSGEAIGLVDGIRVPGGFELSNSGTLVYMPGGRVAARRRLVIVEHDGRVVPWSEDRRSYYRLYAPSRDGRRVAIGVANDHNMEEIWVADLQRHELSRTLSSTTAELNFPCLSPDGSQIVYRLESTDSSNGVYLQQTDGMGTAVRLLSSPPDGSIRYYPIGWSADGSTVYLDKWLGNRAGLASLRVVPPRETAARDLFRRQDSQAMNGTPSPDGRWLGFHWDQSGRVNGYVAALHPDGSLGEPRRLSQKDGGSPEWSGDGRTIYWRGAEGIVAAPFDPSSGQVSGPPRVLLDRQSTLQAKVLPDGRLFAIQGGEEETNSVSELNVVLHWTYELERKMGGAAR